jgi:hypothetical protein
MTGPPLPGTRAHRRACSKADASTSNDALDPRLLRDRTAQTQDVGTPAYAHFRTCGAHRHDQDLAIEPNLAMRAATDTTNST